MKEYYWSIILEQGLIQAAIWVMDGKVVRVMSASPSLVWETNEQLIARADKVLSLAMTNFPENEEEPQKTVFGVPPSWVAEGSIKHEHLIGIKELCSKLSLTPSGFVVLPEAIAHTTKIVEKTPLTGIILGIGKRTVDASLFKFGNMGGVISVERSHSIIDDITEVLTRFSTSEHMPSRILLYDGQETELEKVKEEILNVDWTQGGAERIKFLHMPKVEIVSSSLKAYAVCTAGASEMGEVEGYVVETVSDKHAGMNGVIETVEGAKMIDESSSNVREARLTAKDVGFVIGGDVELADGESEEGYTVASREVSYQPEPAVAVESLGVKRKGILGRVKYLSAFLGGIASRLNILKRITASKGLPKSKISLRSKKTNLIFLISGLGVFLVVLVLAWWYVPRAKVLVYVAPKKIQEKIEMIIDPSLSEPDIAEMRIPAGVVSTEVSGQKSRATTGSKRVGDKAVGTVVVRNGTSKGIDLAGQIILGPNSLKFEITEKASVSAAVSPSSPGTAKVKASAVEIGVEYNLAKGEVFEVGNYPKSEVDAIAESDFAGGSSREVVVVAQSDLTELEDELIEAMLDDGAKKLTDEIGLGGFFVEGSIEEEILSRSFGHKVGEEASETSLDMKMKVTGLEVSREVVNRAAMELFSEKIPSGFLLKGEDLETQFELVEQDRDVWIFDVVITASLMPQLNKEEIAKNIAGKKIAQAEEYLSSILGFEQAEIKISPKLPKVLSGLPWIKNHILVEVVEAK